MNQRTPPCEHCGSTRRHRSGCPRSTADPSTSALAARQLRERGGTITSVAKEHDVSRQSVQQAWHRLYPGEPLPAARAKVERDDRIVALAQEQRPGEIAAAMDLSKSTVSAVLQARGVEPHDMFAAPIQAVLAGEHPVDAAADAGVSYPGLRRRLVVMGIQTHDNLHTVPGRRDGRVARAVARVIEKGEGVPQAAAAERCAPPSVYAALRKIKANQTGPPDE